jgi:hypothetical protein
MNVSKISQTRRPGTGALLLAIAALAGSCITDERVADDWMAESSANEASAPLGGEALVQRKLELDRSYRDLSHFLATLDGLYRRGDRSALVMFSEFCEFYVGKHVLPMLEGEWQSRHPEVAVLDANVRFAVAALWVKLGSTSSSDRMLDEIERRYSGRGEMLVGYPIGSQGTLSDAVARLRKSGGWSG